MGRGCRDCPLSCSINVLCEFKFIHKIARRLNNKSSCFAPLGQRVFHNFTSYKPFAPLVHLSLGNYYMFIKL